MTTLRDVLSEAERQTFVGREAEFARFRSWLEDDDIPSVLNVVGRGGVGKTTLVRAFERHARDAGRSVTTVDAGAILDAGGLLMALGGGNVASVVDRITAREAVLILDTFEQIVSLRHFLQEELLALLEPAVRVVIAGRRPLLVGSDRAGPWRHVLEEMHLDVLADEHVDEYLERRGLSRHPRAHEIAHLSGGHPLALSLAADVVTDAGELAEAPNWQLAVRAIAEQLLRDVVDPDLRALLEAASVVRRFDEDLIEDMTRQPITPEAFRRLVELALVRPRRIGLSVHEDVRRVINVDVRWRAPHRHRMLRARALAHYRRRARRAAGTERQQLLHDAFLLMEDTIVEAMVFGDGSEPGEIELEAVLGSDQLDELCELEGRWYDEVLPSVTPDVAGTFGDRADNLDAISALASTPEARVRLARDHVGTPVGYSLVVPLTGDTTPLLEAHGLIAQALGTLPDAGTPTAPGAGSDALQIIHVAYVGPVAFAANAALWRDMVELFARGGAWLMGAVTDAQTQLLGELGFEPLEPSKTGSPAAMVLDLRALHLDDGIHTDVLPGAEQPRTEQPRTEQPRTEQPRTEQPRTGEPDGETAGAVGNGTGLAIRVLSGFVVTRDGVDVTPTGVGGQLVRALAVGGELDIDVVAELLWPGIDPITARTRVRNVLSRLRPSAGDLVERRGDRLRLSPDAVADVPVFEDLAQRALVAVRRGDASGVSDGMQAIAMINGAVLPADPYADWAAGPRGRIERQLVSLLDALADGAARDGRHDDAARLHERAIDVQPFDESRYLRLAKAHVAAGRSGRALATIERAMTMLDELGLPPSARLRSFVDELRARPAAAD